jgi:hypothetical protein
MKATLIRTDKKNIKHISTRTIETLMDCMKTDIGKEVISTFRRQLPMIAKLGWEYKDMHLMPQVCATSELSRNNSGELEFRKWNGLVLLTLGAFEGSEQVEQAKALAMGMPSTLAAFAGCSGKTVKLLVRIAPKNQPMPESEAETDELCEAGYKYAVKVYGGLFAGQIVQQKASARMTFRMTMDQNPLLNLKATALQVSTLEELPTAKPQQPEQRQSDYDKYNDYEYLYRSASAQILEEMGARFDGDQHRDEAYLTALAQRLRQLGFPHEEAILHMRSHLWTEVEDDHIRTIVGTVYAEEKTMHKTTGDSALHIRKVQQQMMDYLSSRYVFRFNTVMGYTEYRPNHTWVHPYVPVDDRVLNRMAIECRLAGLDVWDKDVSRYIHSSYIPEYNPVWEYLTACRGKWDGKDRIRELARRVPTKNPYWPEWFYTWFLGMVRQWQSSIYDRYGNQIAPLLISKQGWNKSTFIQSLLPPELQWGFTNQLDVSEKRQTLQAMSQFLLINLDEFNQISPQLQQGFLKNVITLPCVKVKRPYGKHVESFPRMASFIGATNQADVLTDPSGGRRFLGIELTGPIDISQNPNYEQIFAQALYALDHHESYYFNDEQTQQILESNRQFQQLTPAEQYFNDCFEPATNENDGEYLTASAIFAHIKKLAGSDLRLNSLNHFGRTLSNIPDLKRRRTKKGTEYLVKLHNNPTSITSIQQQR